MDGVFFSPRAACKYNDSCCCKVEAILINGGASLLLPLLCCSTCSTVLFAYSVRSGYVCALPLLHSFLLFFQSQQQVRPVLAFVIIIVRHGWAAGCMLCLASALFIPTGVTPTRQKRCIICMMAKRIGSFGYAPNSMFITYYEHSSIVIFSSYSSTYVPPEPVFCCLTNGARPPVPSQAVLLAG